MGNTHYQNIPVKITARDCSVCGSFLTITNSPVKLERAAIIDMVRSATVFSAPPLPQNIEQARRTHWGDENSANSAFSRNAGEKVHCHPPQPSCVAAEFCLRPAYSLVRGFPASDSLPKSGCVRPTVQLLMCCFNSCWNFAIKLRIAKYRRYDEYK